MFGLYWGCFHFFFILIFYTQILYSFFVSNYFFCLISFSTLSSPSLFLWQPPTNIDKESSLMWQVSDSDTRRFDFFQKCCCIHFQENENTKKLYSNPILWILKSYFMDTKTENWIQIQSQTSFLMIGPTKNWKWIQNIPLFCSNQTCPKPSSKATQDTLSFWDFHNLSSVLGDKI